MSEHFIHSRLASTITRLTAMFGLLLLILPGLYVLHIRADIDRLLASNGLHQVREIERFIQRQPDTWADNSSRLQALIEPLLLPDQHCRLTDRAGATVFAMGAVEFDYRHLDLPVHAYGQPVGTLTIGMSQRADLVTAFLMMGICLLGAWLVWGPVRRMPLAALLRAETALREHQDRLKHSLSMLEATLDAVTDGVLVVDSAGCIGYFNRRFVQQWSIPPTVIDSRDDVKVMNYVLAQLKDPQAFLARVRELYSQPEQSSLDLITFKDGRILERTSHPQWLAGQIVGRVWAFHDVTQLKRREATLRQAASVFEHSHQGILITDTEGTIIDLNAALTRITGYSQEECLGQNPRMFKSDRHEPEFYAAMWRELAEKGYWTGEIWNRRKNGEVYAELRTISAIRDEAGAIMRYVALFSDITPLKEYQSRLEQIAYYDPLTGLPNRVLLADRMRQAIAYAQRRGTSVVVAFIDLDGFKAINDTHGHAAGDCLLEHLAINMQAILRKGDTLARIGGDEFVAVLTDLTQAIGSTAIIERLLQAAATPFESGDLRLQVSASLGISHAPQRGEVPEVEVLIGQADQAMYWAKQSGKNRYAVFDSLDWASTATPEQIR